MTTKLHTRILSALLAFLLFMSNFPVFSFADLFPEGFQIAFEGEKISEITFFEHEKKTVTAENLPENCEYQWQIQIPGTDTWVDIQGQTNQELGVSYALVGSLLDAEQSAYVRCTAVLNGTDTEHTKSLRATVMEEPEVLILDESADDTESIPEVTEETAATEATEETVPEVTEETAATEATEETVPEVTEESAATEATEETVPETTEETVATEATEETVPEDTEESAATEATEETVPDATEAAEETSAPTEEETVPEVTEEISSPMMFALGRSISEEETLSEEAADNGDIMLLAEGDSTSPEFVTVKIQYMRYDYIKNADGNLVLTDNGQAFNPYVATLLKNSSLNTEVTFPTMVGYDRYLGDSETPSDTLEIDLTNIQEDFVYVVKYKPAQVDYTVRYYFQNVYDDNYVENPDLGPTQSAKGATGSNPDLSLVEAQFPGFTSLYYEPEAIAADGSTEFEVYYERNYYLMEFDCNEGYGTDTLYVRYGTYISVPQPVKTGYVFKGWDLVKSENPDNTITSGDGTADVLPLEMPCYNSAYKAIWETTETQFTVIYWRENADDDGYSYWGSEEFQATSSTTVNGSDNVPKSVSNATIDGEIIDESVYFTYNDSLTDKGVLVKGDGTTIVNVYYDRKTYELRFYYARRGNNGSGNVVISNYTPNGYTTNATGANQLTSGVTWSSYRGTTMPSIIDSDYTTATGPNDSGLGWTGYRQEGTTRYYYLAFRAKYGANIESIWPANAFSSLNNNIWNFGSWATESGSKYRGDNTSNANIVGPYPVLSHLLVVNPNNDIAHNFVAWWGQEGRSESQNDKVAPHIYHIYYEALPSELGGDDVVLYEGTYYKLSRNITFAAAHKKTSATRVDPFEYAGYTIAGQGENDDPDNSANCMNEEHGHYCNTYYYTRNEHEISFSNHNAISNNNGKTFPAKNLKYGENISTALPSTAVAPDYEPPYPDGIEPNAFVFQGWYTTSQFLPGTEVQWNTMTVPDNDVTLYAKWVPVTHNVYFYSLYTDVGTTNYWHPKDTNGTEIQIDYPIIVNHGELLGTTYNYTPERDGYTFIGWFYMDEDNKKRFAPDSMEIKKDLHLFAEWQSGIDTEYKVTYTLAEDVTIDGTKYPAGTEVAPPTEGHSTAGKTKTFTAKGMGELDEKFQANMFPTVGSHSILMDEDKTKNNYSFTYVYDQKVYYQIRYIDYVTGKELHKPVPKNTGNAIVTEKFLPISGYIPMNFYIRKALVSDKNNTETDAVLPENIITFYYTQDDTHGLYSIEYYQETAVEGEYAKYESIVGSADLKDSSGNDMIIQVNKHFKIRSYNGFTYYGYKVITYDEKTGDEYVPDEIQTSDYPQGTLTHAGLTIQLYYKRNPYPYIIEYRESGTEKLLKTVPIDGEKKFGTDVSHTADQTLTANSTLYTYYLADSTEEDRTKTITIRSFETGQENPNKLIFYYIPKEVEVWYKAVYWNTSLTDQCYVSMTSEQATTADGLLGSSAMPGKGFRFVGWYSDEACTTAVDSSWISTKDGYQHLTPKELNTAQDEVFYYALFEPIDLNVTYDSNGGDPVASRTSHIGETITLPTATRTGYTLLNWWYDADKDDEMDEGETYAAGSSFVMPGEDVNFIAQWIDERLDNNRGVYVGINMSFYKDGDTLYYSFPEGEPTLVKDVEAARVYIETKDEYGNDIWTWMVQQYDWDKKLPGDPVDYIDPDILNYLVTNKAIDEKGIERTVIGVFDENGTTTKDYLHFTDADYTGIIQAWLSATEYFQSRFSTANIDWNSIPDNPALYDVIPYVIKRHHHYLTGKEDWFIDVIIVPKTAFKITYELNLATGYSAEAPKDDHEYGQGFKADVAPFYDVSKTGNPNCTAKFLGWHYDKNGNNSVDPGELYENGSKVIMPAKHITLTAVWDYPLILSQTGIQDSAIYEIVDASDNVVLTVALTGEEQVAIYQLPVGDYTIRERTGWTWKYNSKESEKITVTGTKENIVTFAYTKTVPDWLHSETHKENNFAPVPES